MPRRAENRRVTSPDHAAWLMCIERRLALAGLTPPTSLPAALATYLEALARWNARINLTGHSLERPSDEAVDRLIVEPVSMARFIRPDDRQTIDVGSGGGSPALPFRLAAPGLQQVLVESRLRKAAFLREAIRLLGLKGVTVENRRLEELASDPKVTKADIVTMRAVRTDTTLCEAIRALLKPSGRFFWLTSVRGADATLPGFTVESVESLMPGSSSTLVVLK
jgi:16S rRNA (guanine527-N7)-methyltransferase